VVFGFELLFLFGGGEGLWQSRDGLSWHDGFSGVQASLATRKSNEAASDCSVQQLSDGSNSGKACLLFKRNEVRIQHLRYLGMEEGKGETGGCWDCLFDSIPSTRRTWPACACHSFLGRRTGRREAKGGKGMPVHV
jgi:hypothetical protein